jgi:excisionase family DNA binding protein
MGGRPGIGGRLGRVALRPQTGAASSRDEANGRIGQRNTPMNSYWDIRQLSSYLNVKPATLYAWVAQGRIPFLKLHGLVRFRPEEIEQWVESFRRQEPPATLRALAKGSRTAVDELIARAKKQAYNSAPRGNQTEIKPHRKGGA